MEPGQQRGNSTQAPHISPANPHGGDNDDDGYSKSKSQWSFILSRTINKPIDVVVRQLGGLDNFGRLVIVNPVCLEYREVGRDWVVIGDCCGGGGLEEARVREMSGGEVCVEDDDDDDDDANGREKKKKRCYERIKFEVKDSLVAFCGLVSDVTVQRGTFVWDEEMRIGLWEVRVLNGGEEEEEGKRGNLGVIDSWARKVIRFSSVGDGDVTKIEEFVEGYSRERLKVLEGLTKRFTRDLHKNWMKRYADILDD